MAILVAGIAIYSIIRQKNLLETYSQEFRDLIYEAEQLKRDLNIMMENIVDLTRNIIDDLDTKAVSSNIEEIENTPTSSLLYDSNKNKIRIFELAQELNIDSNQLLSFLQGLGNNYKGHMDYLDDQTVKLVRNFYTFNKDAFKLSPEDKTFDNTLIGSYVETKDEVNEMEQIKKAHPFISVRVLHEKGYSVKEIARILGRGQGEVDLLLNLSKKAKVIQS